MGKKLIQRIHTLHLDRKRGSGAREKFYEKPAPVPKRRRGKK